MGVDAHGAAEGEKGEEGKVTVVCGEEETAPNLPAKKKGKVKPPVQARGRQAFFVVAGKAPRAVLRSRRWSAGWREAVRGLETGWRARRGRLPAPTRGLATPLPEAAQLRL